MALQTLKEIFWYRELLWHLVLRDIKIRYKQAILGFLWTMFTPLAMVLIFTFVFSKAVKLDTQGIPYPLFALCGILPWAFFATSLSLATECLVRNYHLVTEVYFPREVFPIATILAKFIDFCISGVFLLVLLIFYKVPFHAVLILVPFIVLLQIMFTMGIALILSMADLFFRDVKYFFDILIVLWLFATPVVYPLLAVEPSMRWVLWVNPMASIIISYRSLILFGTLPDISSMVFISVVSIITLVIGFVSFKHFEHLFAEYI